MAKILKRAALVLVILVLVPAMAVGGYVAYVALQYSRIADNTALAVAGQQAAFLQAGERYTAATYNIGFGAYNHDFSFFMDSGTMEDGTPVTGLYAKARSLQAVEQNTAGAIETLKELSPDFCLLQEVDVKADRSWKVDQTAAVAAALPGYSTTYTSNFHTAYLAYPLNDPIGKTEAGLYTLSRYYIESAVRRSYPVDNGFPTKFFDLDRCFSLFRLPVEGGGELVLINSHMSAYDEGGTIRAAQMKMLAGVLEEEQQKGNWVIVGGDFNHALGGTETAFASRQEVPGWVFPFRAEELPAGFRVVQAANQTQVATCRSTDLPYVKGVNYSTVVDGFVVSANVEAAAYNVDTDFMYSDHNPVQLTFTLKAS